jgi:hypothetical protein
MRLEVTATIDRPVVDVFGGTPGLFAGEIPRISEFFDSSNSDSWICPHDLFDVWGDEDYINYLGRMADQKNLILFNRGDFAKHFCHPNVISLQTSIEPGFRCLKHRTIVVPYNVRMMTPFTLRVYTPNPVISFMGYVPKLTFGRYFRSFWPLPPKPIKRNGALIRRQGLKKVSTFPQSKVTPRSEYSGTYKAHSEKTDLRVSYEDSLINSDFVFCPRGDGNMSQRFYEAISAGRTPIVPDSDMLFPQLAKDYLSDSIIQVDSLSTELHDSVMRFWRKLTEDSYTEHQRRLERLFKEDLSYARYMTKLFNSKVEELNKFTV